MTLGTTYQCLRINWPELRNHKAFVKWFNKSAAATSAGRATWHRGGMPHDYSDLFTWVECGEGSDSDMPPGVWKKLIKAVGEDFTGVVWIDFLGE